MLKIIFLCRTICFVSKFPLEILTLISVSIILSYNLNNLSYYSILTDSLSVSLVLLSAAIIIFCVLTNSTLSKLKKYSICITRLTLFLTLSFFSKNFILFFITFESSLLPLFFLISGWGYQPERLQSSLYFLFYTLFGSLPLLVIFILSRKFCILNWLNTITYLNILWYLFITVAFLIKMPMFLVHLWLPKAHVEAPTVGSMILAGLTLKLGSYALLRLFYLTNILTLKYNWVWISIRLVGNLLLCVVCIRQTDLKSLIAYSSVVHMGLCLLTTLFVLNWSFEGGLWLSLSHGLASSGLFFLTNSTYTRFNRRSLYINKGLAFTVPLISIWWFLILIFNMASPPSLNLFSEIKMIVTTVSIRWLTLLLSVISSFFCAAYCLFLFRNIYHGKNNSTQKFTNNILIKEHLVIFCHLWPLLISVSFINFIQWIC